MGNVLVNISEILAEIESVKKVAAEGEALSKQDKDFNLGLSAAAEIIGKRDAGAKGAPAPGDVLISTRNYINKLRALQLSNDEIIINNENRIIRYIQVQRNYGIELAIFDALMAETAKFIRKDGLIIDELIRVNALKDEMTATFDKVSDEIKFGIIAARETLDDVDKYTYDGCNYTEISEGDDYERNNS